MEKPIERCLHPLTPPLAAVGAAAGIPCEPAPMVLVRYLGQALRNLT